MSLRDLVESDCGGSNSLVKLSTHFVEDHAFKDQDLKLPEQTENDEQNFLEANMGEVNGITFGIRIYFIYFYTFSWRTSFLVPQKRIRSKWTIS